MLGFAKKNDTVYNKLVFFLLNKIKADMWNDWGYLEATGEIDSHSWDEREVKGKSSGQGGWNWKLCPREISSLFFFLAVSFSPSFFIIHTHAHQKKEHFVIYLPLCYFRPVQIFFLFFFFYISMYKYEYKISIGFVHIMLFWHQCRLMSSAEEGK